MPDVSTLSIAELEKEIERRRRQQFVDRVLEETKLFNPVGTWQVKTEGDCEGRTTKSLGYHRGHIVDIAKALADRAYYALHFTAADSALVDQVETNIAFVEVTVDRMSLSELSRHEKGQVARDVFSRGPAMADYSVDGGSGWNSIRIDFK